MVSGMAEEAAEALILWLKRFCCLPRYLIQCANSSGVGRGGGWWGRGGVGKANLSGSFNFVLQGGPVVRFS